MSRSAALAIASSSKRAQQLAVNEFFTRLSEEAPTPAAASSAGWASGEQQRCSTA